MFNLNQEIDVWKGRLAQNGALNSDQAAELEGHLRDTVEDLLKQGLSEQEAFLVAIQRLGKVSSVAQEFARTSTEELWKHLVLDPLDATHARQTRTNIVVTAALALAAGLSAKIPQALGFDIDAPGYLQVYLRNASLFFLPWIGFLFLQSRRANGRTWAFAVLFFACCAAVNWFPFAVGQTQLLTSLHLPFFVWLATLPLLLGKDWKTPHRRMDFLRLTGESVLYAVLLFGGVAALSVFVLQLFRAVGVDARPVANSWIFLVGGAAAPVVAVRLAQAKRNVVENLAPVLARIFGPLFLLVLAAFLAVLPFLGQNPFSDRDWLIGFDVMLVAVLGLVVYSLSSREPRENAGFFDAVNFALIALALLVDALALSALGARLTQGGLTANKLAALGENVLLLVDLAGCAALYLRFFVKKRGFEAIVAWQTRLLTVFFVWFGVVAFAFPPIFGFR